MNKLIVTDNQYEIITKGIAFGTGIGTLLGLILNNIVFNFSLGGVLGVLIAYVYSIYKK